MNNISSEQGIAATILKKSLHGRYQHAKNLSKSFLSIFKLNPSHFPCILSTIKRVNVM
jgi:hypothetical protein